jgi:hypothetical protein
MASAPLRRPLQHRFKLYLRQRHQLAPLHLRFFHRFVLQKAETRQTAGFMGKFVTGITQQITNSAGLPLAVGQYTLSVHSVGDKPVDR